MSTLKVLQKFSSQRTTLLSAIGAMDPSASNLIFFNLEHFKSRLSHDLDFQIHTIVCGKHINHIVVNEGTSTCVMCLSCSRSIGSPDLIQAPATLKTFDGSGFNPYGIFNSLAIELWGKTISIDVEVVNTPLDYNLLLGHSFFLHDDCCRIFNFSHITISSPR